MAITIQGSRYEEIKRIVVNLFVRYKVSCIPVNGFELATKMGIRVIPYSSFPNETRKQMLKKSIDGFCAERTPNEWYLFYNDEMDYRRINNTILHEIGHIALDHSEDSELAEKEVKFFAKYALVPPVLVHKLKLDNPHDISVAFEVSYEAACYAYAYYQKWLNCGLSDFTDYERVLLRLFSEAS